MKGHHGVLFTPSFGSLSATAPRAMVNDDGDVVTGDDNNNGDHDGDNEGNGDGTMGSVATGYDDDGDDDDDV